MPIVLNVAEHAYKVTGKMPPPPQTPPADVPILIAVAIPAQTAPAEGTAPEKLPKTASELPLVGLLGLLFLGTFFGLKLVRGVIAG